MTPCRLLVVNPGSTSTKIAIFEDEQRIFEKTFAHSDESLRRFRLVTDQLDWRLQLILNALAQHGIVLDSLSAVVGRGGRLRPVESGTFRVNDTMLEDSRASRLGQHASYLGCLLADAIARPRGLPAYVVDPVSVDEMWHIAKITGLPGIERRSLSHALNMKAVARKAAEELGLRYKSGNFVVVHLGGGGSVSAHHKGLMVDLLSSDFEGPFSVERAGAISSWDLVKLCFAESATEDTVWSRISGGGGLYAHLGTKEAPAIEERIAQGDDRAELVYRAMAYGVAKAIGCMAVALSGDVDATVISGGLAHSSLLIRWIRERVEFLAPVLVYPGGFEMEALAMGALRVLRGEETPHNYP
jgi:butyrate kinase